MFSFHIISSFHIINHKPQILLNIFVVIFAFTLLLVIFQFPRSWQAVREPWVLFWMLIILSHYSYFKSECLLFIEVRIDKIILNFRDLLFTFLYWYNNNCSNYGGDFPFPFFSNNQVCSGHNSRSKVTETKAAILKCYLKINVTEYDPSLHVRVWYWLIYTIFTLIS